MFLAAVEGAPRTDLPAHYFVLPDAVPVLSALPTITVVQATDCHECDVLRVGIVQLLRRASRRWALACFGEVGRSQIGGSICGCDEGCRLSPINEGGDGAANESCR